MGVEPAASGLQTAVIGTEHSLSQLTGVGIYVFEVDTSAMVSGDSVELHIKTTCRPGDDLQDAVVVTLSDVQVEKNWHSVPVPLASGNEIAVAIKQVTGTGKTFKWNLMRM